MITVPSCDKHNSEKSFADKAILTSFAKVVLEGYKIHPGDPQYTRNIMNTVAFLESTFDEVEKLVVWEGFYAEPTPLQINDMVYFKSTLSLLDWVKQLTAALVWHVVGHPQTSVEWDYVEVYNPYLYPEGSHSQVEGTKIILDNETRKAELDKLTWHRGWSAYPKPYPRDIFRFDLTFDVVEPWHEANVLFRHVFFNGNVLFYVPVELDQDAYATVRIAVERT